MIYRILLLMLADAWIITISGPLAVYIRYNLVFEPRAVEFIENILHYLPLNLAATLVVFMLCRLYRGIWKYASASDLVNILAGCALSALMQTAGMKLMGLEFPRSYPIMYFVI